MTDQISIAKPSSANLQDPEAARAYCRASHLRADSLVLEIGPEARNLTAQLRRAAAHRPDHPLVRVEQKVLSATDLCHRAAVLGGMLTDAGVCRNDKVALICGNRIEFMELLCAIAWIGAVAVPINTASRGLQLQHILENSGANLLIVEQTYLDALTTLDRGATPLPTVFVLDAVDGQDLPHGAQALPPASGPVEPAEIRSSDPLAILYTSGTTGLSKGVICPHAQFFWWAITTGRQLGVSEGDVLHTTLPLFHTNALNCFFQALVFGATQSLSDRFSVSRYYSQLKESGATVTYLLGAMVPMLLSRSPSPAELDHQTRVALAPGVPAHFHAEFLQRTGILLLDAFGSTETNNVIQTEADSVAPGLMGRVTRGFSARVVDDQDNEVPNDVPGELILRADEPFAFASGYLGMAEATVETWRNLWVHTGDRVRRHSDGTFSFVDRIKETIRRRGENISSFEVELAVLSHPAVATAAAYPVRSELAEDEVMVAIVLKPDCRLKPVDLIRHCEGKLPYFAIPRYVSIRDDLPRTENGKIQKFKLRDEGITTSTWDREAEGIVLRR